MAISPIIYLALGLIHSAYALFLNDTKDHGIQLHRRGHAQNDGDLRAISTIPKYISKAHQSMYNSKIQSWYGIDPKFYYKTSTVVLGEGAFGKVVKAEFSPNAIANRPNFPNAVAIKEINLNGKDSDSENSFNYYDDSLESFIVEEIKIMRSIWVHQRPAASIHLGLNVLGQRNILKFYDSFKFKAHYFIILEFMELGSLTRIAKTFKTYKIKMTESVIAWICHEVLQGLSFLHDKKFVHRDIKPDNILIGSHGEIKIGDFGISGRLRTKADVCKKSIMCGTESYMAPEVGHYFPRYGSKVDIWSLGVTIMELHTGEKENKTPENLTRLFPSLSPTFKDFVRGMLVSEPKFRKSANELLNHPFIKNARNNTWLELIPCLKSISLYGKPDGCPSKV